MKEEVSSLPTSPGCYQFKDSDNKIIYIGKAKNIKKRVASYFNKKDTDPKTKVLVSKIKFIEPIVTKNEIEALLLENTLIKKHKPKYNIELKDSKSYSYIELTKEKFPRFIVYRSDKKDQQKTLIGPFTSGKARDDILQVINKTFKIRTCRILPKKPCLRYSIGICSAPCINRIKEEEYNENIESAKQVINGRIDEVIKNIEQKMSKASKNLEYERAINFRNQIDSLDYLKEKQNVERNRKYNEDIINYIIKNNKVYLVVFNIFKGTLSNKQEYIFENIENFLEQFLKQYYSENEIPKEIIVPDKIDESIEEYLSFKKKSKVSITIPKHGEKKELLYLVIKNIEVSFFGDIQRIETLKRILNLHETPTVIECFDISHLSGTNIVASMVQFRNGRPDKSNYRRYRIKTVEKNDDFASMREVVKRRYSKLKSENRSYPNLVIIDGGIGQLNASIKVLEEIGVKIPIISLAKEFEEVYLPGRNTPIRLDEKNKGKLLLQAIRDEAHRFAVKYNRLLRKKEIRK